MGNGNIVIMPMENFMKIYTHQMSNLLKTYKLKQCENAKPYLVHYQVDVDLRHAMLKLNKL